MRSSMYVTERTTAAVRSDEIVGTIVEFTTPGLGLAVRGINDRGSETALVADDPVALRSLLLDAVLALTDLLDEGRPLALFEEEDEEDWTYWPDAQTVAGDPVTIVASEVLSYLFDPEWSDPREAS